MHSFLLCNEAVPSNSVEAFSSCLRDLISIAFKPQDAKYKHDSCYSAPYYLLLWDQSLGQEGQAFDKFIEQLSLSEDYCTSVEHLDSLFPNTKNAFLGGDFSALAIEPARQVSDSDSYSQFCTASVDDIDPDTFWAQKSFIFPSLVFCGDTEKQLHSMGGSADFRMIMSQLLILHKEVEEWDGHHKFPHYDITKRTSLDMSMESPSTMNKYGSQRVFRMPHGGPRSFELHIKIGSYRVHILPNTVDGKVYIGYIGSHLSTAKFK